MQTAVVVLATVATLGLLGMVSAYWTWQWFAPGSQARAQSAEDAGGHSKSAASLFGIAQKDRNNIVAQTGIAIRLLGIVAATGGRRGYAVVQFEPRQILAVREGEDVAPGIRIAEIATDHVILERGGIREMLAWPEKRTATEPAAMRTSR